MAILEVKNISKSGVIELYRFICCFAFIVISANAITFAREVSFTRTMTSFDVAGITRFVTCGRIILKNVCIFVMPSIEAASYCPFGIASIPPLNISAKYAA